MEGIEIATRGHDKIGAQSSAVGSRRLDERGVNNVRLSDRQAYAAKVRTVKQIGLPSLPNAATSFEGVAPATSRTTGPEPPRSVSPLSSATQFVGAQ